MSYKYGSTPSAIRALFSYGLKRKQEIGEEKVFDFSLGNPSIPSPEEVKQSIIKHLNDNSVSVHSYSMGNGIPYVRETIANAYKKKYNFPANPKHVYVTSGAAGAISAALHAITNPDDEIIVNAPFFAEYAVWIENCNCKLVKAYTNSSNAQLDPESIKDCITSKTAAIIINSPNNPTGAIYSKKILASVAKVLDEAQKKFGHDIFIISDEPYRKITYGNVVPFVPLFYKNTIICDSASKSLSLPGERIGHIYVSSTARDADNISLAVAGAARALGHVCAGVLFQRVYADCFMLDSNVDAYAENRKLLTKIMDKIGWEYVEPQGAFYLWVKSPIKDAIEFSNIAKKYELLIVPSDSFGIEGWIRLGYCISKHTIINSEEAFLKLASDLKK